MTAALANLTFMSPLTSSALQRCNTARTLVKAVRAKEGQGQDSAAALFAKDQVRVSFFLLLLLCTIVKVAAS